MPAGDPEPPADESAEDAELAALMGGALPAGAVTPPPGGSRPPTRRSRRGGDSVRPLQSLPYTGRRL
jgi:hypothetical protein